MDNFLTWTVPVGQKRDREPNREPSSFGSGYSRGNSPSVARARSEIPRAMPQAQITNNQYQPQTVLAIMAPPDDGWKKTALTRIEYNPAVKTNPLVTNSDVAPLNEGENEMHDTSALRVSTTQAANIAAATDKRAVGSIPVRGELGGKIDMVMAEARKDGMPQRTLDWGSMMTNVLSKAPPTKIDRLDLALHERERQQAEHGHSAGLRYYLTINEFRDNTLNDTFKRVYNGWVTISTKWAALIWGESSIEPPASQVSQYAKDHYIRKETRVSEGHVTNFNLLTAIWIPQFAIWPPVNAVGPWINGFTADSRTPTEELWKKTLKTAVSVAMTAVMALEMQDPSTPANVLLVLIFHHVAATFGFAKTLEEGVSKMYESARDVTSSPSAIADKQTLTGALGCIVALSSPATLQRIGIEAQTLRAGSGDSRYTIQMEAADLLVKIMTGTCLVIDLWNMHMALDEPNTSTDAQIMFNLRMLIKDRHARVSNAVSEIGSNIVERQLALYGNEKLPTIKGDAASLHHGASRALIPSPINQQSTRSDVAKWNGIKDDANLVNHALARTLMDAKATGARHANARRQFNAENGGWERMAIQSTQTTPSN